MKGKKGIFKNPLTVFRVFPRRLTNGGVLIIDYCLRTIGYCFPYCFLEIFVGRDKALMKGAKVMMDDGGIPQSPHSEKHWCFRLNGFAKKIYNSGNYKNE